MLLIIVMARKKKEITKEITKEEIVDQEKTGIRHLVECNCFLPQNIKKRIWHKFPVFSIIDEGDNFIEKIVQCNNCGFIHKVIEVGKSEPTSKERSLAIRKIDEIKMNIPEVFSSILEQYHCDISIWEEVEFKLEQKMWGSNIVISKEIIDDGTIAGKLITIKGPAMVKFESFTRQDYIS